MSQDDDLTPITLISKGSKTSHGAYGEIFLKSQSLLPHNVSRNGLNLIILNRHLKVTNFRFYNFGELDVNKQLRIDLQGISDKSVIIMLAKKDMARKLKDDTRIFIKKHLHSKFITKIETYGSWGYIGKKENSKITKLDEVFKSHQKIARLDGFYNLNFQEDCANPINYTHNLELIKKSPVKQKILILCEQIRQLSSLQARMNLLKNYFQGEKCFIISCGPSVNDYDARMIKRIAGSSLVFCIKQSYNLFEDICDFHLTNFCNNAPYQYSRHNIISVYQSADSSTNPSADLSLVLSKPYLLSKFRDRKDKHPPLSKLMNFEDYLFEKTLDRPSGPGIMYEIPIYLAIHMGIKDITILGWDCSYKKPQTFMNRVTGMVTPIPIENSHFYGSNSHTNREISKIVNENIDIIKASKYFYIWLQRKGVDLKLGSNRSMLDKSIPRIDLKDLYIPVVENDHKLELELEKEKAEQKKKDTSLLNQLDEELTDWKSRLARQFQQIKDKEDQLIQLRRKLLNLDENDQPLKKP